jgi:hypothetical protein
LPAASAAQRASSASRPWSIATSYPETKAMRAPAGGGGRVTNAEYFVLRQSKCADAVFT